MEHEVIPRLPVFGWQALQGQRESELPCLLNLPGLHYSTSGRAAILLALEALGVGTGHTVLLPSYHCPTMVAPAASLGALPMFYPIDEHGTPDLAWLSAQPLGRVRVLLAAHYFGLPQPMCGVRRWCDERGIALIEDCAHALFGSAGERAIGAWGNVAVASLTKFLPVPEGGCLVVNNAGPAPAPAPPLAPCGPGTQLRAAMDILEAGATQGRVTGLNTAILGSLAALRALRGGAAPAGPTRAQALNAAVIGKEASGAELTIDAALAHRALTGACRWVAAALPRARIVASRRSNYALLTQLLADQPGLHPLQPALPAASAPYVFPLWVDVPDPGYLDLLRLGMPVFRWDRLWPAMPHFPHDHGRLWSHHVLQLSCHQDLAPRQLETMVRNIVRLCAKTAPRGDTGIP